MGPYAWRRLALARTEHELAARILSDWTASIGAGLAGIYLWTSEDRGEVHTRGASHALLEDYEAFGRLDDPLFAKVVRKHNLGIAAIHAMRARSEGYAEFAARHCSDFDQYAIVPLIANGTVTGTICLSLERETTADDKRRRREILQALQVHASTRLAQLRQREGAAIRWEGVLGRDDLLLCDLAAGGHTVAAMAGALGVSVNTVKKRLKQLHARLDVASRAELVMQYVIGPEPSAARGRATKRIGRFTLASQS